MPTCLSTRNPEHMRLSLPSRNSLAASRLSVNGASEVVGYVTRGYEKRERPEYGDHVRKTRSRKPHPSETRCDVQRQVSQDRSEHGLACR